MDHRTGVLPRPVDTSSYFTHQHPEAFLVDWKRFYREADERTAAVRRAYRHESNVFYGDHPNQIVDMYYPDSITSGSPVLIFLHGGAFHEGHPAHYGFLARAFVEHSIIFISAGYRLIPEARLPESIDDIAQAIAWVYHNIRQRGGDPERIFLSGHSAGALLTARLAFAADWQAAYVLPVDVIKGAVPISARYNQGDAADATLRDHSLHAALRAMRTIERVPLHTILAFGPAERNRVDETVGVHAQAAAAFAEAIRQAGGSVTVLALNGLDHPDTASALGDVRSPLFEAAVELMRDEANR
jgi:arylformamidase